MAKQFYFMFAGHRYDIVKRGFKTAKQADDYSWAHYSGQAQYHKIKDGEYVLGVHRTHK